MFQVLVQGNLLHLARSALFRATLPVSALGGFNGVHLPVWPLFEWNTFRKVADRGADQLIANPPRTADKTPIMTTGTEPLSST